VANSRESMLPDGSSNPQRSAPNRISRVAIVGAGLVGSTTAYALLLSGLVAEIVLIDKDRAVAEGQVHDLRDAELYSHTAKVLAGEFSDCGTADVIVITAGMNQSTITNSRAENLKGTAVILKDVLSEIGRHDPCGILLVASNPVDVMTYATWKWSGLPINRVIGSGTSLDTSRFRRRLAERFAVAPENVHAYIIGEHGDSQVPVLSSAHIACMSLEDFCREQGLPYDEASLKAIAKETRTAGLDILHAKGGTCYGIATALARIVRAIVHDENAVLTVSSLAPASLNLGEVCLSLPATINRNGVGHLLSIPLNEAEQQALKASAETLKGYIDLLDDSKAVPV
jgi:L-lactate dehydrogenase